MCAASSGLWVAISAARPVVPHPVEQELEDPRRGLGIEVAGRLVGEEQPRPVGERAGEGDALLLAPESSAGLWSSAVAEPDAAQQLGARARRVGARQRRRRAAAARRSPAPRTPAAGGGTGR